MSSLKLKVSISDAVRAKPRIGIEETLEHPLYLDFKQQVHFHIQDITEEHMRQVEHPYLLNEVRKHLKAR